MLYRNLGNSGLQVSAISIGSWQTFGQSVDYATTRDIMAAAFDAGINFFDAAEAYGGGAAEDAMGKAIAELGWRRDSYIISGKASNGMGSGPGACQKGMNRKHLVDCCDMTLARFGVDYLDIFFCHRPDPETPLEETVRAMNELIQRGKIMYWGTSEFSPSDLIEMHRIAVRLGLIGPQVEQTGHNMLGRARVERDLVPLFDAFGMGATVYCPLAGGLLTGKYNDGIPEGSRGSAGVDWIKGAEENGNLDRVRKLSGIAADLGCTTAQLALAWLLKNPHVSTALGGATKISHIESNVGACEVVEKLTDDVMAAIEDILGNKP
jgi:voltage-dependent potassium channel beta subunit